MTCLLLNAIGRFESQCSTVSRVDCPKVLVYNLARNL